jgi:histidinol phosphatase-like PHP family hydrolase
MARAAQRLGMRYLTITDHSPSAHYAGGVDLDRLKRQWDEIAAAQEAVKEVTLLRGTESDILEDGSLDYPDAVLEQLDVVIASVHSRFKMDEAEMTRRLVRAMKLPVFKIWGHARGRLLLEREPFACRMEEVLDALAGSRGAVEVNGDPHRLELEPRFLRLARERGIPLDADHVGARALLEPRPQRPGGAAEVEYPPRRARDERLHVRARPGVGAKGSGFRRRITHVPAMIDDPLRRSHAEPSQATASALAPAGRRASGPGRD